jgi:hypothetical protein
MNPFSQLVQAVTRQPEPASSRVTHESFKRAMDTTRTAKLLHQLTCNGPMTTSELAESIGLAHTRYVWGLLKAHVAMGQVATNSGLWRIDASFPGNDVVRAVDLLRSQGWKVSKP